MKRILVLIMIMVFMFAIPGFATEEPITHGELLKDLGIVNGSNGELNEDKEITRQEMVAIINRLSPMSESITFELPSEPTFSDVSKDHWAFKEIEEAYFKGLTNGIGEGKFGLDQKINYNQASLLLIRTLGVNTSGIDYNTAAEKIKELQGLGLSVDKPSDQPLVRGDIFELMVKTLQSDVIDRGITKLSELNFEEEKAKDFINKAKTAKRFDASKESKIDKLDFYSTLDRGYTDDDIEGMPDEYWHIFVTLQHALCQDDSQYEAFIERNLNTDYEILSLDKLSDFTDLDLSYIVKHTFKVDEDHWFAESGYDYYGYEESHNPNIDTTNLTIMTDLSGEEGFGARFSKIEEVRQYGDNVYMIISYNTDANYKKVSDQPAFLAFELRDGKTSSVIYGNGDFHGMQLK